MDLAGERESRARMDPFIGLIFDVPRFISLIWRKELEEICKERQNQRGVFNLEQKQTLFLVKIIFWGGLQILERSFFGCTSRKRERKSSFMV